MFNFMKWRWLYLVISAAVIVPGLISLVMFGLKPSLDFTGGSLLEVRLGQTGVTPEMVVAEISDVIPDVQVTQVGEISFQIKGQSIDNSAKNHAMSRLEKQFTQATEQRFETLGPAIGRELILKTGVAIGLSCAIILLYLAKQFSQLKYGVLAVVAMIHDSLVLIGSFSLLGHFLKVEVDVLFVTALLTTLSFSVHDTIVVYDRIRELQKIHHKEKPVTVINAAIWQTMTRSLNNSITVIVMLLALVLLGGETIKWFAMALLIGAVTGTYSSTFVAVPLLYTWDEVVPRLVSLASRAGHKLLRQSR